MNLQASDTQTSSTISRKWILSPLGVMYLLPTVMATFGFIQRTFAISLGAFEWFLSVLAAVGVISMFVELFALLVVWTALVSRPDERSRRNIALVLFGTLAFVVYLVSMGYAATRPIH